MNLLKKLKDWTKNDAWEELAIDIGGKHIQSAWGTPDALLLDYKNWRLKITNHAVGHKPASIMIRVPFKTESSFNFNIYREGLIAMIGKTFGMQDIVIGDHEFDRQFIIKSNNESQIKKFLDSEELKRKIEDLDDCNILITKESYSIDNYTPKGVKHLVFRSEFGFSGLHQIKPLTEIFKLILDRLVELNIASDEKVDFEYS